MTRCRLIIQEAAIGDGDHAADAVNGEAAASVVSQAVGHRWPIGIRRRRGDANQSAIGSSFRDAICREVRIRRCSWVDVGDRNAEAGARRTPSSVAGLNRNVVTCCRLEVQKTAVSDCDYAATINGKAPTGAIGQTIRDEQSVRIRRERGDAN